MCRKLLLFSLSFVLHNACFSQGSDVQLDTVDNYNSWGWKALKVDNGFIQLLILPEIGGRVLHYGFEDDTYMAVNTGQIDRAYDPSGNQSGPWTSWGYGGYKVWPAPQSVWNWPPPPYLDWGGYTWSVEHASADSVIIYLKSMVETYRTPGLQQARRFRVYKNSTRVKVEQILKNVSNTRTEWSVWEVTQAIIDHDGSGDYENISTYFPSAEEDIKVLMSPKIQTTEVEENVRKFNYAGNNQKIGTLLKEGWACFVDEQDDQAYAKIFDMDPVNGQYPDQNSNFQLYVGGSYIEIEVLGPLTDIAQGDSVVYVEYWYAAGLHGPILTANHAGIVRSRLAYNLTSLIVTGEYGIFNNGSLRLTYYSEDGQEIDADDPVTVTATEKFALASAISLPENTEIIKLLAYDVEDRLIGTLDSFSLSNATGARTETAELPYRIYPTMAVKGTALNIDLDETTAGEISVEICSLAGGKPAEIFIFSGGVRRLLFDTTRLGSGIYLVTVQQSNKIFHERVIIL